MTDMINSNGNGGDSSNGASSGLWKRQSSIVSEVEETIPLQQSNHNNTSLQIKSGDSNSPTNISSSNNSFFPTSNQWNDLVKKDRNEKLQVIGHIFLSMLISFLASVVVPLARQSVSDSIRTQNIPYQTTKAGDILLDFNLNHPLIYPPTVSANLLVFTCVFIPFCLLILIHLYQWKNTSTNGNTNVKAGMNLRHEVRASICGLFTATAISEGSTNILKLYVSRYRPNFYSLCGFDTTTLSCLGKLKYVREASLSFPSGHSSLSWCGMTYIALFLLGRVATIPNNNSSNNTTPTTLSTPPNTMTQTLKPYLAALSCLLPWSYSTFVSASRIVDWWHHPSDVVAGSLIGIASAMFAYHQFYPSIRSYKAGLPLTLQSSTLSND